MKRVTFAVMFVCVVVAIFTGCATRRYYSVEVSNVPNITTLYIRNAGMTSWGVGMSGATLQNIDTSRFSERVDIRVVDTTGAVFSSYNVPFDSASFVVTERTSEDRPYIWTWVLIGITVPVVAFLVF